MGAGAADPTAAAGGATLTWGALDGLYAAVQEVARDPNGPAGYRRYRDRVLGSLGTTAPAAGGPSAPPGIKVLKAKQAVYEYCFEELAQCTLRYDPPLHHAVGLLYQANAMLLDDAVALVEQSGWADVGDRKAAVSAPPPVRESEVLNAALVRRVQSLQEDTAALHRRSHSAGRAPLSARNHPPGAGPAAERTGRRDPSLPSHDARRRTPRAAVASPRDPPPAPGPRIIPLQRVKALIEDIYAARAAADGGSAAAPNTVAGSLAWYCAERFGPDAAAEWADAIVAGAHHHAPEDNDVAVFSLILQHRIDDEFPLVQRHLRHTARELLRLALRQHHPVKTDEEVTALLERKWSSSLQESEWGAIVRYMYAPQDAATICVRVREAALQSRGTGPKTARGTDQIPCAAFVKVLQDFQLQGHERFLRPFVAEFRQWDTDADGVLTEPEFRGLLRAIAPTKPAAEVAALLEAMDPTHARRLTFSECVAFLADELVALTA